MSARRNVVRPERLKIIVAAADVFAAILLILAVVAAFTNGINVQAGVLRFSVRTPWRPFFLALAVMAARIRLEPQATGLAKYLRDVLRRLPNEEGHLFGVPEPWLPRIGRGLLLVVGFSALVAALTWPQVQRLDSVPDVGDPLFSIWRIAWVNHQIVRDPLHLFDANSFYPERFTLTYSDAVVVPALMSAPLFWIRLHPVVIYNLLLLSGFVLSGVTMFMLVRALTDQWKAAMIAGAIFALYPFRYEHYPHLELQMTMWMPLALLGMHRTMAAGRLRDGLATGGAFALQALSSLYYGLFLAVYLVALGGSLWLGRGRPRRPLVVLAAGAVLAAVLVAPVVSAYIANRQMVGDRGFGAVKFYSAVGSDYLKPHFRSLLYGQWSSGGNPERQLFPRVLPVVLAAVALWPPLSVTRIAYAVALFVAVDGSFGLNGSLYPWLYEYLSPFKGLRVPARFSMLAGMTLAILSGYGAARIFARWPRRQWVLAAGIMAIAAVEAIPQMPLEHVWREPPDVYRSIANEPSAVLAEFPMPTDPAGYYFDTRYLYFSTFHWHPMVNGNSGYFPQSYMDLTKEESSFPAEHAVNYLRDHGVQYVVLHGAFFDRETFKRIVRTIEQRGDMPLLAVAPWEGSESRLYRLPR